MALATIAVAAIVVVSRCSDGSAPPGAATGSSGPTSRDNSPAATMSATIPSPSPSPSPPPATVTSAAAEVLRAYGRFWAVAQAVDRGPVAGWRTVLSTVAGEPLLDDLLEGLQGQHARGVRQYGQVRPHPSVADLTGQRAVVVDCQDASGSGLLDEATGKVEQVGAVRTPVSAVLRRSQGAPWLVTEARYLSYPC
jgi:hypothetical protein